MEKKEMVTNEFIRKSNKRIKNIYDEISKGLRQGSMKIDMVRVKLSEAGLLIKEMENSADYSYSED